MKKTRMTKFFALFLAILMLTGGLSIAVPVSAASGSDSSYAEILASLTADSYLEYLAGVKLDGATQKEGVTIPIDIFDYTASGMLDGDTVKIETGVADASGATPDLLVLPGSGTVTWKVDISAEQAGLYGIRFEYYPISGTTSSIERKLYIDGSVPFDEARALSFGKVWKYNYVDKEGKPIFDENGNHSFRVDLAGNDIRATIEQAPTYLTYECTDTDGFYNEAFQFYFEEGSRTISLASGKEGFAIKSITLYCVEEMKTLDQWQKEWADAGYTNAPAGSEIYLRAEAPDFVSDSAVYPSTDRSSAANTPIDAFSQKLNVIGATSYNTTGQWAEYIFTVEKAGIYNIYTRFKQSALQGMFASRVIKLSSSDGMYGYADGTPSVPYEECYYTRFNYSNDWQIEAMNDGEQTLEFYLKPGVEYKLRVEVGLGNMAEVLNTLENSLSTINNCYLEILKLTGADPDEYRDYGFRRIMPQTVEQLGVQSDLLYAQADALEKICGTTGSNIATLRTIADLLERMEDEDEIASNLSNLKSYIGTLGTWINTAKSQSITVDYYKLAAPDTDMGKASSGFFKSLVFELRSFIASFFVDYDAMGVTEESTAGTNKTISVWLAYGRDQSQIWKNLITNDFTVKNQIAVDLKLVAGGTLLPSVLAQQGPDAYIGLAAADTINYAIRNAILNIEDQPGYNDVLGYDSYDTQYPVKDEDGKIISYKTVYISENGNPDYPVYKCPVKDENGKVVKNDAGAVVYKNVYVGMDGVEYTPNAEEDTLIGYLVTDSTQISFNAATMIPISLNGKTYGLPEQANVAMMFYRKDILAELEIDVPETWDDMLAAIPVLQANNMAVGFTPNINLFVYQFGGDQWKYMDDPEYAGAAIGLDTDVALDAFQYCTRLYTDYSFPYAFDGPNRFRTGEIPLLIADYVSTYNQLTVFATEIRGLWEFTNVPGTIRADGTVNRDSIVTVTATVMLHGCKEEEATWKYMMWQARGDVQSRYGNEMVALVGPAAKYATANLQGLRELSWSSTELSGLLTQFDNLAAIPNYPGSYIIGRYTNFAFLAAYNNGEDAVSAMQDYISVINQELSRKRKEFGMATLKDGQTPEEARLEEQNKQ